MHNIKQHLQMQQQIRLAHGRCMAGGSAVAAQLRMKQQQQQR
jgi:hypothetical protein